MTTETNYAEQFYTSVNNEDDKLKKNTDEYPFSAVARFLLLYHYKKNNNPSFDQLAKQSAIYFNNIPWIQYQLSGIKESAENSHGIISSPIHQQTEQLGFSEEENQNVLQEQLQETDYAASEPDLATGPVDLSAEKQITDISYEPVEYETETLGFSEEENQSVLQEEPEEMQYATSEQVLPADIQITDISDQDKKYETETLGSSEEENRSILQEVSEEIQYATIDPALPTGQADLPAERQITDISDQDMKYETQTLGFSEEENQTIQQEIPPAAGATPHEADFAADEQNSGNSIHESEDEEELIAFEPLHTVDYFASQGIKISEEALENDHLGQQVKSFTAWLKSMKKLHPGQLPEQNEVIEKIIQSSAEVSNQSANILTEAMAEVLIKQGKREKAIEMYGKLSLMNPSKSAYFAAKIESLKTT